MHRCKRHIRVNPVSMKMLLLCCVAAGAAGANTVVRLSFHDSVIVRDTAIRLGDLAVIAADSSAIVPELAATIVGEAAPPGYFLFVNTTELMTFRLRQNKKNVDFLKVDDKRIKVVTAAAPKKIGDYDAAIRAYLHDQSSWGNGRLDISIDNANESWNTYDAPLTVTVSGLRTETPGGMCGCSWRFCSMAA